MRRRTLGTIALLIAAATCGFVAGSWWHAELSLEPPPGAAVAPIRLAATAPARAAPSTPAVPEPKVPSPGQVDPRCVELAAALAEASHQLAAVRLDNQEREERHLAKDGFAIPIASGPHEPRFEPAALRTAISEAFTQARVPGRVDGLDCSEWPCIIYGRIRGTEDEMEKLEGAKALATYEHDVLTVLLWVATDEAAHLGPLPILPGRPEQSLFAFAFYPRGLGRAESENIDRRLRSRTAELWNTMSPADETGR